MELIRAEDIICGLASQFVVHNRNILSNCGILMSLRISCDNHGYERDGNTFHRNWRRSYRKNIHFIIVKHHSVFVVITDEYDWRKIPMSEWKNTSNHDTCWRSDGLCDIFTETMKAYHACYDHVPEKHRPAPIAANISATFSPALRNPLTFVEVVKKYSEDDRAYRYILSSIRDLNPKFPALEGEMFHT
jgi:hypothetical protein